MAYSCFRKAAYHFVFQNGHIELEYISPKGSLRLKLITQSNSFGGNQFPSCLVHADIELAIKLIGLDRQTESLHMK